MQFDIYTLLVAVAASAALCTAARAILIRLYPDVPGLRSWTAAGVLGTIIPLLLALDESAPTLLSRVLPQFLAAAGLTLHWDGFRRFGGHGPLPRRVTATVLTVSFLTAMGAYLNGALVLHMQTSGILIALLSLGVVRELLRTHGRRALASRTTAALYGANAFYFAVRVCLATWGDSIDSSLHESTLFALTELWWLMMSLSMTLGMVLMTSERLLDQMDRQANRDSLTGAMNRRLLAELADREIARARRNGRSFSVLMMDLDHFKAVNDRLGHSTGDEVLCLFAATVNQVLRREDIFCRFGGEEFLALLPDTAAAQALVVAERLRMLYAQTVAYDRRYSPTLVSTVSIGVGEWQPEEEFTALLDRADAALYRAKAAGRNRCELAELTPPPDRRANERRAS